MYAHSIAKNIWYQRYISWLLTCIVEATILLTVIFLHWWNLEGPVISGVTDLVTYNDCDVDYLEQVSVSHKRFRSDRIMLTVDDQAVIYDQDGNYPIIYTARDILHHKTTVTAHLTVIVDREPPVILGVTDIVSRLGDPIDFDSSITVSDNLTVNPILEIDTSNVDISIEGEYTVIYTAVDEANNITKEIATVSIIDDLQPPIIEGVKDISVLLGEAIFYRDGITVTDNRTVNPSLTIDSSKVNIKEPGAYDIVYIAVDEMGNVAREYAKVIILESDKDGYSPLILEQMISDILDTILTEEMSISEQARAIYRWVTRHIYYTGWSDTSSWEKGAYRGIKYGYGDCFTYYSVSRALLTAAGIDNLPIERVGGYNEHYWNLVNCGSGWYHFDATVSYSGYPKHFMMTDEFVKNYTIRMYRGMGRPNFYTYDESLYPKMATTLFQD